MAQRDFILLYIEKYLPNQKIVVADFVDSNEFTEFSSIVGFDYDWIGRPTMIEFSNYSQKKVSEGTIYKASTKVLQTLIKRLVENENSFIIGFTIRLTPDDQTIFGTSKSFSEKEKIERFIGGGFHTIDYEANNININNINKIVVRNVGQGSSNELWNNDSCAILFDCGTLYSTSRTDLLNLVADREEHYKTSKPLCVISHWDVDHYHFLLAFSDETIKSFSHIIYRDVVPTLTARKAIGRFNIVNESALLPLAVQDPPQGKKSGKELHEINLSRNNFIFLYNGTRNRSRNKSGIGLVFYKTKKCVIFSADFEYEQISKSILDKINYSCEHFLVVPHHGGKAGKFVYDYCRRNKLKDAIISVGKNPYKHPLKDNIENLKNIGFNVIQTLRTQTDYVKEL